MCAGENWKWSKESNKPPNTTWNVPKEAPWHRLFGHTQNKEDLPPKRSSPPSGGPTRLGIRRSTSARKRSGVSGRSRSKRKAFSSTKR